MIFNRKVKKLEKEIEELDFNLKVQTRCHNDWFQMYTHTISAKWQLDTELREANSELYACRVKIQLLEDRLANLEEG